MPVSEKGGDLWRVKDEKKYHVTGTKGYKWVEREIAAFRESLDELSTDMSYFKRLTDDAIKAIEQFVPFNEFVS